jgi:hypothetical protein
MMAQLLFAGQGSSGTWPALFILNPFLILSIQHCQ